MLDRTLTQSELLSIWERGAGQRPSRRALALLEGVASDAAGLEAMPVGQRDALLLDLRDQLFGGAFAGVTGCPACGEETELSFGIGELRLGKAAGTQAIRVVEKDYDVEARLPTTADLAAIERFDDLMRARATLCS